MVSAEDRRAGCIWGSLIGDALAMPVHWYYDRAALRRDYGVVRDFLAPREMHPDSILWRSQYVAPNPRGDILREQARYWGQRGVHYHQFLRAGENTLNLQLARLLLECLQDLGGYDADEWLERYIAFMLTPGRHRDTYVEEYHRHFFAAYARGVAPRKCGGSDLHIGGLAQVGVLCAWFGSHSAPALAAVSEHLKLTHRDAELVRAGEALVRILGEVFGGEDLRASILRHGSEWFSARKADRWSRESDEVVVGQRVSSACYIHDAFPASLYLAWKYALEPEAGLIANTNLGGDNCHRGAVVGALLGAAAGAARLPVRWRTGLCGAEELERRLSRWPEASTA